MSSSSDSSSTGSTPRALNFRFTSLFSLIERFWRSQYGAQSFSVWRRNSYWFLSYSQQCSRGRYILNGTSDLDWWFLHETDNLVGLWISISIILHVQLPPIIRCTNAAKDVGMQWFWIAENLLKNLSIDCSRGFANELGLGLSLHIGSLFWGFGGCTDSDGCAWKSYNGRLRDNARFSSKCRLWLRSFDNRGVLRFGRVLHRFQRFLTWFSIRLRACRLGLDGCIGTRV